MIDILVILQCAYANSERRRKQIRKRKVWLKGLWNSHTGRRLRRMLPENSVFEVINTTLEIGVSPDAVLEPDIDYIKKMIEKYNPGLILACGKVACKAMREIGGGFYAFHHPAWRQLTNEKIDNLRESLEYLVKVNRYEKN